MYDDMPRNAPLIVPPSPSNNDIISSFFFFKYHPPRASKLRIQRMMAATIGHKKANNHLLECFQNWSAIRMTEKDVMKKKFESVFILKRMKCTSRHFSFWLKKVHLKENDIVRCFDNVVLRRCMRDWRMMRPIRLLKENFGVVCGVHRVYLQRAWCSWKDLFKKKCRIAYALSLLKTTADRMRARKALLNWPGWREHRKSEEMKSRLIVKHIERTHLLSYFNHMAREDKENTHSAINDDVNLVQHVDKKRLTLAERVAVEAVHLLCPKHTSIESSRRGYGIIELTTQTTSYHTALSVANKKFMRRKAAVHVNLNNAEMEGTTINSDRNNKINKKNNKNKSNNNTMNNKDNNVLEIDFLASLDGSSSREELAVRELLLFLQIVFLAWRKVAKNIRLRRVKARQVVHARGKVSTKYI